MRIYKTRMALATMGSAVIHGAASTFLAILPLAAAKSYIFLVFFRMWFGIIFFGVANGFILLPVMLSFMGPLKENETYN
jgi:Niemann-Pick C1 protein